MFLDHFLDGVLKESPMPRPIMDESGHQINRNSLKKSVTSLSAMIGAFGSPLGPHQKVI
jgi:hypothetical protein